jgi:hypothetical protein
MKFGHVFCLLICLSVLFLSCNKENAPDLFKSTGEIKTVTKPLQGFHSLKVFDHIDIELKQGNEYKVEITAGKNLIPKIDFNVTDSLLTIENKNTANWVRNYQKNDVKITLYFPTIKKMRIEQYGSGTIYSKDTLKSNEIGIDMQSSGDFDITVDCFRFSCVQYRRNFGNIKVKGTCVQLINVNDGTGEFNSMDLHCQYARVETINKGNSYAYVPGPLKVKIADSGNIYISGNPNPVEWIEKKGSGNLILF